MPFDFVYTIVAETFVALPLNELVDEVGCLEGPAVGDVLLADLHLLLEDLVTNLLPGLSHVWPPAHHALEGDHSESVVVNSESVILLAENLRGHVAGGAAGLLGVLLLLVARYSKVSDPQVALLI